MINYKDKVGLVICAPLYTYTLICVQVYTRMQIDNNLIQTQNTLVLRTHIWNK